MFVYNVLVVRCMRSKLLEFIFKKVMNMIFGSSASRSLVNEGDDSASPKIKMQWITFSTFKNH